MKVGFIFECGPHGADKKVCEHLARRLLPDVELVSVTLDNKPGLIADCGEASAQLLNDSCSRVIIIWDLFPPWREKEPKPCRMEERQAIQRSLSKSGVKSKHAHLVCIQEELEAWLLADGRALSSVLSRPTHPVKIKDTTNPERVSNPKKRLKKLFKQHTQRDYNDLVHAERIVQAMPDLNRIAKCATFERFAVKLTG